MMDKPLSVTVRAWLLAELGARRLAPLTEKDHAALDAAMSFINLYTFFPEPSVIQSFAVAVWRMQPGCQQLAYHAIAHLMQWSDRSRVWDMTYLPPIRRPWVCLSEPRDRNQPLPPIRTLR